jgi:hypothetical protein
MPLVSTHLLIEMRTRNLPGVGVVKCSQRGKLAFSAPSVSRLPRESGSFYDLEQYGPPWPVTGIVFFYFVYLISIVITVFAL